jgi:hypothetical protein
MMNPQKGARWVERVGGRPVGEGWLREFTVTLAVALFVTCATLLLLGDGLATHGAALCRYLPCPDRPLAREAYASSWSGEPDAALRSMAAFEEALRRNPASAYRWADLADALARAGDDEKARACFDRAVEMGPLAPPILNRAGNFYLASGDREKGMALHARILEQTREYDGLIFSYYDALEIPIKAVFQHAIAEHEGAAQAYFRHLLPTATAEDVEQAWRRLLERDLANGSLPGEYVSRLLNRGHYPQAKEVLAEFARRKGLALDEGNLVFNGSFEHEALEALLDWNVSPLDNVHVSRDDEVAKDRRYSLKVEFDGSENLVYRHAWQKVVVSGEELRFQGFVRTRGLTTDEGVAFRIFDAEQPSRLSVRTPALTRTTDWQRVEKTFLVPGDTRLVQVQLTRERSGKIDNRIAGTVWIDAVELR